ncbi:MAG: hypothetical protein ABW098_00480 [Candidatus Thiodiazotropha sp.]
MEQKKTVDPGKVRKILPKSFATGNPVIPDNLVESMQFQAVTKKKSKRVNFLPELPFIDMKVSTIFTLPSLYNGYALFLESRIGVVVNEGLNMSPIPGNRAFRYTEKFQHFTLFAPENLFSGICGRFSLFHEMGRSMQLDSLENIWRHKTIFRAGGITRYSEPAI